AGAIAGALLGGRFFAMFAGAGYNDLDLAGKEEVLSQAMAPTLMIPAIAVTLVLPVIFFFVPESQPAGERSLDWVGFSILTIALLLVTSGLTMLKPELWGSSAPPWVFAVIVL